MTTAPRTRASRRPQGSESPWLVSHAEMTARDELRASAGARSKPVSLLHLWTSGTPGPATPALASRLCRKPTRPSLLLPRGSSGAASDPATRPRGRTVLSSPTLALAPATMRTSLFSRIASRSRPTGWRKTVSISRVEMSRSIFRWRGPRAPMRRGRLCCGTSDREPSTASGGHMNSGGELGDTGRGCGTCRGAIGTGSGAGLRTGGAGCGDSDGAGSDRRGTARPGASDRRGSGRVRARSGRRSL